ncbi:MAG: DEAD/DEAH box helicase family protein [Chloroflexi bacterium]|nr:DEAD/DEAH box helicase family protein [Chloroflexota bacterium]
MPRPKRNAEQPSFLENYGKTAPAVPAIRTAVNEWRESGYKGATKTSRELLNYWFRTDHRLPNGRKFEYHFAQREAVESMIYVFEIAKTRRPSDLYERFVPAELARSIRLPGENENQFARYAIKMATGSGKTKVMSLAIAWQYFNAVIEADPAYAKTFLIIAPNVIVYERLASDFAGAAIFRADPVVPKDKQIYWDMQTYMRGESERASSMGALYLTNISSCMTGRTATIPANRTS